MQGLTKRQKMVLDFINRTISSKGYPPTLREIGAHMGIRSTNGVNDHLRALERKGYLKREDMKSRALRPLESTVPSDSLRIPIVGSISAGAPILAEENIEGTLAADSFFTGRNEGVFLLRVSGDSMIDAGILDGDYVFVRQQATASPNEIIIALIGEEATVKYYKPHGDLVRLQPANKSVAPVIVHRDDNVSFRILGVVIGVYRKL